MSATIGSTPVLSAEVTLPRVGAWSAIGMAEEVVPAGAATLTVAGQAFVGTVLASPAELLPSGLHAWRMVGGAGGLGTALVSRYYRQVPASVLLQDIASDAGEVVASDASLALALPAWARPAGSAGDALRDLVGRVTGAVWRVRRDGQLWVGVDAWADSGVPQDEVLEVDTVAGVVVLSSDAPMLEPGTLLRGERVSAVVIRQSSTELRTDAWIARPEEAGGGDHTDRLRWALDAIVRQAVPTSSLRIYRCRVLAQNADRSLELRPDAASGMPDLSRVPLRALPGVQVELAAGAYVEVAFADGDLSRPFAMLGDETTSDLVRLTFAGGSHALAREGDDVHAGTVTAIVGAATPVVFTYTPHGGLPQPASPTLVLSGGHITSGAGWGRG